MDSEAAVDFRQVYWVQKSGNARRHVTAWVELRARVLVVEVQRAGLRGVEPLVARNAGNRWRENLTIIRSSVDKKILTKSFVKYFWQEPYTTTMWRNHLAAGSVKIRAFERSLIANLPLVCMCRSDEMKLHPASRCTSANTLNRTESKKHTSPPQTLTGHNKLNPTCTALC